MSQPLYFLPGVTSEQLHGTDGNNPKLNRALLEQRGLAGVFADVGNLESGCGDIVKGPGDRQGCLLYYQRPDGKLPSITQYAPHAQEWSRCNDGLYIGLMKDSPVTAEDLRRRKQIKGLAWELGGRGEFTVPIIRRIDGTTELPRAMVWDEAGNVQEPVLASHLVHWERAGEIADWLLAGAWEDRFMGKALGHAVELGLGLNYRFGRNEQNTFRLIEVDNLFTVLGTLIDYHKSLNLAEAQKKTP